MTGVNAWLAGCTMQELRNSAVGDEPIAMFLRHRDWDMLQVAEPGAPPAPPVPQQAAATGIYSTAGTHLSTSGAPGGGDQSSVTGLGSGGPEGGQDTQDTGHASARTRLQDTLRTHLGHP